MPRQVRRHGSASMGDQYQAIVESIHSCDRVLENVSRLVMTCSSYFDGDTMKHLIEDIMSLSNANVQVDHTVNYSKRNLESMEADGVLEAKAAVKRIKSDLNELSKTDTSNSEFVKKIGLILQVRGEEDEEEGIVMVESGDTEAIFTCPYTVKLIETPMKHDKCQHKISKTGLDAMLKNRQRAPCPVPGCMAHWSKGTSTIDKEFEKRLNRFLRVQRETAGTEHLTQQPAAIIDDDDEEYTQI